MADSAVRLPPDSTGTSLRTVTNAEVAAGAHQEVVTLATAAGALIDPATQDTLEAVRALLAATLSVAGSVTVSNPTANPETGLAKDATLTARLPQVVGTWDYYAGASGTVNVGAGRRVVGIAVHATTAATMTINGGAAILIPPNSSIDIVPNAQLVAPALAFTGTDSYFVETVA